MLHRKDVIRSIYHELDQNNGKVITFKSGRRCEFSTRTRFAVLKYYSIIVRGNSIRAYRQVWDVKLQEYPTKELLLKRDIVLYDTFIKDFKALTPDLDHWDDL